MNHQPPVPAIVKAINYTGAPQDGGYAASQVTYDLDVLLAGGQQSVMTDITPAGHRPPETTNIIPCPIGCLVWGAYFGGALLFDIREYDDRGSCP